MELVIPLIGVALGGGLALAGQLLLRQREEGERHKRLLLDDCAVIFELEDEFMAACGIVARGGDDSRLQDWSRRDRARAGGRIRMLANDHHLIELEDQLRQSGRDLFWSLDRGDGFDKIGPHLDEHRQVLDQFLSRASQSV